MEDLRLRHIRERNNKDNGNMCRVFSDKQLNDDSMQYFGTGSSSSSNSWGAAEHAALRVWENMVGFMLAKNRTEQWYFYSAAQPCEATVKNQYRAKIVVDGRDYHMPWQRTKGRRLYRKVDDVEEVEEEDENVSYVWQRSLWGKCTSNKCLWETVREKMLNRCPYRGVITICPPIWRVLKNLSRWKFKKRARFTWWLIHACMWQRFMIERPTKFEEMSYR